MRTAEYKAFSRHQKKTNILGHVGSGAAVLIPTRLKGENYGFLSLSQYKGKSIDPFQREGNKVI